MSSWVSDHPTHLSSFHIGSLNKSYDSTIEFNNKRFATGFNFVREDFGTEVHS